MSRILVFDSGFGGLSIVKALRAISDSITIDYAADFDFFPYGDKPDEALALRLPDLLEATYDLAKPDVIVLACNTATTLALEGVRARVPCPVVGTVPAIKPAAQLTKTGVIGLLATPATIGRVYTDGLIEAFAADLKIIKVGSSALVRLAEDYLMGQTIDKGIVWAEQRPFFTPTPRADTIVLGCTHFPHITSQLAEAAREKGHAPTYIDPSHAIAKQTLTLLPSLPQPPKKTATTYATARLSTGQKTVFRRFGYDAFRPIPLI